MSQNNNNNTDSDTEISDNINSFLESMNRNIAANNRRRRSRSNQLTERLRDSQVNVDRIIESRRNLRQQLEDYRCNYVIDVNTFCPRMKATDSMYCVHHNNEFNGVNSRIRLDEVRIVPRPGRQVRRSSANIDLNVSSSSNIDLNVSSSSNVELDISLPSNVELDISLPSNINGPILDISSSSNFINNINIRERSLPANQIDFGRSLFSSSVDMTNIWRNINMTSNNVSSVKKDLHTHKKCGKCTLCQKTVSSPSVNLRCDHKYHLKCFLILNTDSDNKINLMDKCMKCDKKLEVDVDEPRDCSICLEKLIDDDIEVELPCKHRFHVYCIQTWSRINKNCPLCRADIS